MRSSRVAIKTLLLLLACIATATAMTGEDAIDKAVAAEEVLDGLPEEVAALTELTPTETTETIDGVVYTVSTYTDQETNKTFKRMTDPDGNVVKEEFFDPETGTVVTMEYDEAGNVVSNTVATVDEEGKVLESTKIEYNEDGTKTYTTIDYTDTAGNNKVTTVIAAGGDISNPDDIVSQDIETEPVDHTCPNTGQSEIDV